MPWPQTAFLLLLLGLIVATGCSTQGRSRTANISDLDTARFKVVTVGQGQNLKDISQNHLGDADKWWQIAALNNISDPEPGQSLIIPRVDLYRAGLSPHGYQTVPVLAYLKLAPQKSGRLVVSRANFERQMKFLKTNGYHPVSIRDLMDFLEIKKGLPPKAVMITFDNGWRSVYEIAFPILKKYRFPATVFVYTDFIGAPKALSWKQLKQMAAQGISIQSQTVTLTDLTRMAPDAGLQDHIRHLEHELGHSQALIQKNIGAPCRYLAYPFGRTNDLVIALAKKFGYRAGFTLNRGSNPFFVDNFKIKRSMIYGHYGLSQFARNLKTFEPLELR